MIAERDMVRFTPFAEVQAGLSAMAAYKLLCMGGG